MQEAVLFMDEMLYDALGAPRCRLTPAGGGEEHYTVRSAALLPTDPVRISITLPRDSPEARMLFQKGNLRLTDETSGQYAEGILESTVEFGDTVMVLASLSGTGGSAQPVNAAPTPASDVPTTPPITPNEDTNRFSGTRTAVNLRTALEQESLAVQRYLLYAVQAAQENLGEVSRILSESASNESEHAELWYKQLYNGDLGDTEGNLHRALLSETEESQNTYPEFARIAREEGFDDIAALFEQVGEIEARHARRFSCLIRELSDDTMFNREPDTDWRCPYCGYSMEGSRPPESCPICGHDGTEFGVVYENEMCP